MSFPQMGLRNSLFVSAALLATCLSAGAAFAQVPANIDMAKPASTATFDFAGKEDTSPQ